LVGGVDVIIWIKKNKIMEWEEKKKLIIKEDEERKKIVRKAQRDALGNQGVEGDSMLGVILLIILFTLMLMSQ
jgi:hypothetical protein